MLVLPSSVYHSTVSLAKVYLSTLMPILWILVLPENLASFISKYVKFSFYFLVMSHTFLSELILVAAIFKFFIDLNKGVKFMSLSKTSFIMSSAFFCIKIDSTMCCKHVISVYRLLGTYIGN